jgi:translation initiation factor 2 beta subunit (eIF-2beta)/eIF-5
VEAELFHADGLTKLIFVFHNSANAAKNDNAMLVHSLVKVTTRIHHEGQVQLILHHATKAHRTVPLILKLGPG